MTGYKIGLGAIGVTILLIISYRAKTQEGNLRAIAELLALIGLLIILIALYQA